MSIFKRKKPHTGGIVKDPKVHIRDDTKAKELVDKLQEMLPEAPKKLPMLIQAVLDKYCPNATDVSWESEMIAGDEGKPIMIYYVVADKCMYVINSKLELCGFDDPLTLAKTQIKTQVIREWVSE